MHYAALANKPFIISTLIMLGVDVNTKQQINYLSIGPISLHLAARCDSLDAAACLIANYSNVNYTDHDGWV
jgi:hypothetical protein